MNLGNRDIAPAWYTLSAPSPSLLVIAIHNEAVEDYRRRGFCVLEDTFQEQLRLPDFVPISQSFGFGGVIVRKENQNDWSTYHAELPRCVGSERGRTIETIDALRASLSILFQALWRFDGQIMGDRPQLMMMDDMRVGSGTNQAAFSVELLSPCVEWISRHKEGKEVPGIAAFMIKVMEHLRGVSVDGFSRSCFGAHHAHNGRMHLSVAGSACGLSPGRTSRPGGRYPLVSNNIDSFDQQLALLMGLARLHDLASP